MAEGQSQSQSQSQGEEKNGGDMNVAIEAHQNALDDLVNANSIFTLAVFIGLSVIQPGDTNLQGDNRCNAEPYIFNKLIVNEVLSFSFYLLSSLVAKALKSHLYTYSLEGKRINKPCSRVIRGSMLSLSALGSVLGSIFLTLSMVEVIEIRLGKLSCKNTYTLHASGALIALVVIALAIYAVCMIHAIYTSVKKLENDPK